MYWACWDTLSTVASTQPVNLLSTFHWDSPWREKIRVACGFAIARDRDVRDELIGPTGAKWWNKKEQTLGHWDKIFKKHKEFFETYAFELQHGCLARKRTTYICYISHSAHGFCFCLPFARRRKQDLFFTCASHCVWSSWSCAPQPPPGKHEFPPNILIFLTTEMSQETQRVTQSHIPIGTAANLTASYARTRRQNQTYQDHPRPCKTHLRDTFG
jgi:hypothetical protein